MQAITKRIAPLKENRIANGPRHHPKVGPRASALATLSLKEKEQTIWN